MSEDVSASAIGAFFAVAAGTLIITYWAARRTRSTKDFYAAGGGLTSWQNGLAIAGDFLSAVTFLGLTGFLFSSGYDTVIYLLSPLAGLALVIFLMAERFRNLGRFTFADVASYRLGPKRIRSFAACGTLTVVLFYLIAQMVGAGALIEVLFRIEYNYAVTIVGALMIAYVSFGGMLATSWVQIIKACLLLAGVTLMATLTLQRFGFNVSDLVSAAVAKHPEGESILNPGGITPGLIASLSLGVGQVFGTAAMPHVLMRFFTVKDSKAARKSIVTATSLIGYVFVLIVVLGFGAIVFVMGNPAYYDEGGQLLGGRNMPAIHLAMDLGGEAFMGVMSAVAFATILAVVAGLTIAGASAISHDLYANVFKNGDADEAREVMVSRIAALAIGLVAILLGILFQNQNVGFLASLAFAIAASANFPVLILSMFWRGLTTRGAFLGGFTGLISAIVLVVLGPTVSVAVLGMERAPFAYDNPSLFTVPLGFLAVWLFSVTDRSARAAADRAAFDEMSVRSQTGVGAEGARQH